MNIKTEINVYLNSAQASIQSARKTRNLTNKAAIYRSAMAQYNKAQQRAEAAGDTAAAGIIRRRIADARAESDAAQQAWAAQQVSKRDALINRVLDDNIVSEAGRAAVHAAFASISATEFNRIPRETAEGLIWGAIRTYWAAYDNGRTDGMEAAA